MVNVRVGRSSPGGFDRVVPAVCLIQVGQGATIAVGAVLRRIGNQRNALAGKGFRRKLAGLWPPAPDGITGVLRLGRIDAQATHSKPSADIVDDVNGVAVDDSQDGRSGQRGFGARERV